MKALLEYQKHKIRYNLCTNTKFGLIVPDLSLAMGVEKLDPSYKPADAASVQVSERGLERGEA